MEYRKRALLLACLILVGLAGGSTNGQGRTPGANGAAGSAGDTGAANGARGLVLVANKADRTLSLIDVAAGREVAAVPEEGITGHEVIASPDGKTAYVPIYGDSGVGRAGSDGRALVVIDLASRKITGRVDFGRGVRPHCPLIGPKDGLLYVTTELDQTITIIDPKTLKIVGTVPTGAPESHMLAIAADGRHGYTANVGVGSVSVLDLQARKTVKVIPVAKRVQRIAVSADGKVAITADQDQPRLAFIDTASHEVKSWVTLPAVGFSTAPTRDGRWLVVTMPSVNKVAVVDLKTQQVAHTIDMPPIPQEVMLRPDGRIAYVSCDQAATLVAIRTSDWQIDGQVDAGKGADGLAWAAAR